MFLFDFFLNFILLSAARPKPVGGPAAPPPVRSKTPKKGKQTAKFLFRRSTSFSFLFFLFFSVDPVHLLSRRSSINCRSSEWSRFDESRSLNVVVVFFQVSTRSSAENESPINKTTIHLVARCVCVCVNMSRGSTSVPSATTTEAGR